jgi:hypothetical protein
MPDDFQPTIDGSSSNVEDTAVGDPPLAGIVAITPFAYMYAGLAIAVSNAMREPSGDQTGLESGPSCVTSVRTDASATLTIEISAVPPNPGLGFAR